MESAASMDVTRKWNSEVAYSKEDTIAASGAELARILLASVMLIWLNVGKMMSLFYVKFDSL